jgi:hypothetical protein
MTGVGSESAREAMSSPESANFTARIIAVPLTLPLISANTPAVSGQFFRLSVLEKKLSTLFTSVYLSPGGGGVELM